MNQSAKPVGHRLLAPELAGGALLDMYVHFTCNGLHTGAINLRTVLFSGSS